MDSKDVYATLAHYFNEETTITNQGQPFDEDKPKLKLIGRFLDYYACNSFMGRDLPGIFINLYKLTKKILICTVIFIPNL